MSVNVRGLNTYEKRVNNYDWLTAIKVDIVLLQETPEIPGGLANPSIGTLTLLSAEVYRFYYEKIYILK